MRTTERCFVINTHLDKGGHKQARTLVELGSHEAATKYAYMLWLDLVELTGECQEGFEIFVGSKAKLIRYLEEFKA